MSKAPRSAEIAAAMRVRCAAAMPAVWSALGLPPGGPATDDDTRETLAQQIATDRIPKDGGIRDCVAVADGAALIPPEPMAIVGMELFEGRNTIHLALVFREGAGASRLVGHFEAANFGYGPPRLRLERLGHELWVVLETLYHPGSDPKETRDSWYHIDGSGGEMPLSLQYTTDGVTSTIWPLLERIDGHVIRAGLSSGMPVIELRVRHSYVDDWWEDDNSVVRGFTFLAREGRRSFRWNSQVRRFVADAARSSVGPDFASLRMTARSALLADGASFASLLRSGTAAGKAAVRKILHGCASDPECAAMPEYGKLRTLSSK